MTVKTTPIGSRVGVVLLVATLVPVGGDAAPQASPARAGAAFFVRSLVNPADRREARPDVLDAPILPGSVMKVVTLVAALESQVLASDTAGLCRRVVTVEGRRYVCSHPDLKRPLTPAEALAHSCNDFFVSLAPRLPRAALNEVRARLGLPPVGVGTNFAAALVGLDGPRMTPRAILDVVARVVGADPSRPVAVQEAARRIVREGLRGAAQYGTAAALGARNVEALAKTGTAPMSGGSFLGLVVALEPAEKPTRGVVVVAPGAAGVDAASIAAELLAGNGDSPHFPALSNPADSRAIPGEKWGQSAFPADPAKRGLSPFLRVGMTRADGSTTVEPLALEDYVARVLAGEGQPAAADGAQQALAITARTFALANRNRHRREGYDLCDTTHCQVLRASTATTRRAAEATAGRILVHQGQPASVFYSASCGGRSELASAIWPGAVDYEATPHDDEACEGEPEWSSEIRAEDIERALRTGGHHGDRLNDLRILDRNRSGRVARVRVEGFTPDELSGHDFRMAVGRVAGWQTIKSTAFDLTRTSSGYRFRGRGFGHGVGLCVIGAGRRAERGTAADEILRVYFPSLRVGIYDAAPTTARASGDTLPRPAAAKPATTRVDVLVALPAAEEGERAEILQLVRAARDQVAARASVTPPATIRVTVHPTVEAFGRATGQPWWTSGATDDASIDLLPLAILRQRGQVERTIRHEVAHVLLDGALSQRPLWVREGAASYFAAASSDEDRPDRTTCPADEEFLRPVSAGAHRAAYARANACFRRAIASGKSWKDVR